ncbi:MAG: nucleotidyltransferase domain-containing protein [Patescibacteria group bacterium]|jgi:predicted nucleotidyltransferase
MDEEIKINEFNKILEQAKNDDRVIGLILAGGRGKGMFTENSDYDVAIITTDESILGVKEDYKGTQDIIDIGVLSISEFRIYAAVGTAEDWDRYTYAHIKARIDKTGEIQKIIDEKGILPQEQISKVAKKALCGYLNSLYRALKNHRDGNEFASRLDACESLPWLLTFLFAVEGRVRPYNKFLKWELENYPLKNLPISSEDFLAKIELIIKIGDIEIQKEFHKIAEEIAVKNDCVDVIDDWAGYYFARE